MRVVLLRRARLAPLRCGLLPRGAPLPRGLASAEGPRPGPAACSSATTAASSRVCDAGVGFLVGGVGGSGVGAPCGSIVGLIADVAINGSGVLGFVSGALVGCILGGGVGAGTGLVVGATGGRGIALSLYALPHAHRTARFGGAVLEQVPLEPLADAALNRLPFRGRLLCFVIGVLLGSGGLSFVVLQWRRDAAGGVQERRSPAALESNRIVCSGVLQRWVWFAPSWWLPHWQAVEAQVTSSLLLMRPGSNPSLAAGDFTARAVALPLAGMRIEETTDGVLLTMPSKERDFLRINPADRGLWCSALGSSAAPQQRVVIVDRPASWSGPLDTLRIVPLRSSDPEYRRVAELAESQQFRPAFGKAPYVKGNLKVTGVARVQSPHIWDQYCLRRSIIAQENDGDPNEQTLWHGTSNVDVILKTGFDPRVCSLGGMFGGGVYFADKSTKSVRYCGNSTRGQLLLCRVSLGRPILKRTPQKDLRRPPDPSPVFPSHVGTWLRDQKFHSVFASSQHFPFMLLMNEYIVYHTNQAYPEYVVDFEMR